MLLWPNGWAHPMFAHFVALAVFAVLITVGFLLPSPAVRFRGGVLFDSLVRRYVRIRTASGRRRAAHVSDRLLWTLSSWAVVVDGLIVAPLVHHDPGVAYRLVTMDAFSLGLSGSVLMLTKKVIGRERPHVTPEDARHPEHTLSFFGGHAAMSFTGAGLVWMQHRHLPLYGGGAWDLVVPALALVLAAVTAMLRVAADKHYLSDVLVGSTLGLFSGLVLPSIVFGG
jgi:membrane-associated phospholipid phosphatase